MNFKTLFTCDLEGTRHRVLGRTRHLRCSEDVTDRIRHLEIRAYNTDPGTYLIYLDENRRELNDTYHDSVELAMEQATFEFGVVPSEWIERTT